jgi:hypothetical protein
MKKEKKRKRHDKTKQTGVSDENKCLGEGLFLTVNYILSMRKID